MKLIKNIYAKERVYAKIPLNSYIMVYVKGEEYYCPQDFFDIAADTLEEEGAEIAFLDDDDDDGIICGNHCRNLDAQGYIYPCSMSDYYKNKIELIKQKMLY